MDLTTKLHALMLIYNNYVRCGRDLHNVIRNPVQSENVEHCMEQMLRHFSNSFVHHIACNS